MESNEVLDRLPRHLLNLIIDQPYTNYTAQDHAVWRYIMRQNTKYLPGVAHPSYLEGLKRTGISINRIPNMYGMNRILKDIGWAAVAVDGFIPPAAFMEFQAYNVLVIAADIRSVDQVLYTPAPDIIHEAAGHAPIIADDEYSQYLRNFGRVGSMAFSSVYDYRVYKAIRHLSILKADPYTPFKNIAKAEAELDRLTSQQETPSEMALLRNLHWWTVEYGLIGTVENPKIYGAGLLSSIDESHNCLKPKVKKLTYSLEAKDFSFDITTQQPQLFVTPDFKHLNMVLEQFTDTMSVRQGGFDGLEKGRLSATTCTVVYSSGLQVSGKLVKVYSDTKEPVYIGFEGPSMLCYKNQELEGHGTAYHKDGFGSPVGKIRGIDGNIETMSEGDLLARGIVEKKEVCLDFNSGVQVNGRLEKITRYQGFNLLFSFQNCTVRFQDKVLFKPEWGIYDMAIGERISSTFSGPANPDAFGLEYPAPKEKTHHIQHTRSAIRLNELYRIVEALTNDEGNMKPIAEAWQIVKQYYPEEWLLPLEMAEILINHNDNSGLSENIVTYLNEKAMENEDLQKLIVDGMRLITNH